MIHRGKLIVTNQRITMLEIAAITAIITEAAEVAIIPTAAAFLSSELIAGSKSKHNGLFQLAFGLIKAVAKEITEAAPETDIKPVAKRSPRARVKAVPKAQAPQKARSRRSN